MPRKRQNELIRCRYFSWRLSPRQGVWQADGRSNEIDAGRHSLGTRDRDEALDRLQRLDQLQAAHHGLAAAPPPDSVTTPQLSLEKGRTLYEEHVARPEIIGGVRPTSRKRYRAVLDKFLDFCRERRVTRWEEIDVKLVQRYAAHLEEQDYAWRTIYLEVNTVKQIVKWLIKEKLLSAEQAIELPLEKARGTSTYCWKPEEVAAMVGRCRQNADHYWLGDVLVALACTGLRIGELSSLRWSDLDLDEAVLRLTDETTSRRKSAGPRRTTKTGHGRSFPIHPDLLVVLKDRPRQEPHVFCGPRGGRLKPDTVRRILIREVITPLGKQFPSADDEIGFADGRLHRFRHYFCSMCANSGVPEQMVMRWLGHRSSEMVRHYYHLHDEEAKRRMSELNFLGKAGGRSAGKEVEPKASEKSTT